MLARRLDELGIPVFAACLTNEGAEVLQSCTSERVATLICDVTNHEDIEKMHYTIDQVCKLQGIQLWAVVNNAGIGTGWLVELNPIEVFKRVIDVNLMGVIAVTKMMLPLVRECKGRVINVASMLGRFALPGLSAYAASKFGVEGFSDSLRREMLQWGVKVVLVEPGFMKTPMCDKDRVKEFQKDLWARAEPTIKKEYGGTEFFDSECKKSQEFLETTTQDPVIVIDALIESILSVSPKSRYLLGKDATLFHIISWLPTSIQDRIYYSLA